MKTIRAAVAAAVVFCYAFGGEVQAAEPQAAPRFEQPRRLRFPAPRFEPCAGCTVCECANGVCALGGCPAPAAITTAAGAVCANGSCRLPGSAAVASFGSSCASGSCAAPSEGWYFGKLLGRRR